jgi:hypothetical protein
MCALLSSLIYANALTAKAFDILEKVKRARRTLDNRHSAWTQTTR